MGIEFQSLVPDVSKQQYTLPDKIRDQNQTVSEALNTKVGKRKNIDTDEDADAWEWNSRAVAEESLGDMIAEKFFGKGEAPHLYGKNVDVTIGAPE